ncbi:RNase HII [Halogeometricum rufum]|uniref:Ribonuclease HII n=1 Tax=Halogeometricum rufum TaxID=553469 RepID=A0A1I6I666_9EURY|nr:ribonuclease HII [Halogeometricum rufum]SFR62202.1 RNase HII [Halogeometricum rufum]
MHDQSSARVGSDEAGKGPVLGPMVAAAVRATDDALPDGIDDSKRLAPSRRETIAETLEARDDVSVGVALVEPARIDDPETDMNSLTVAAHVAAVAAVARDGDEVVTDAGDVDEARFGRRVRRGVADSGTEVSVVSEHGADETYPHVGAASIVAKVERDARMAAIGDDYAAYGPVGSGYPSDPTTREFLRTYVDETGELPDCARASWSTCDDVLAAAAQSSLAEF